MENERYNNLIINGQLDILSKIDNIRDLVHYKYNNRYLIEYLLEKDIHSYNMDSIVIYDEKMASFYLKYRIIEPLLNCHLNTLLKTNINSKRVILDELLSKLNQNARILLYQNIKSNSYWAYHDNEDYVIEIFKKYWVSLPKIFMKQNTYVNPKINNQKMLETAILEFRATYRDHNENIIDIVLSELLSDYKRNSNLITCEINSLINYKKEHPNFKFMLSNTSDGSYDKETETMKISQFRKDVLTHELSHLLYENNEQIANINTVYEYESICESIDNTACIEKIINYLKEFHKRYNEMEKIFEELYYHNIRKKYHSYEEYIKSVCRDIAYSKPEIISVNYGEEVGYFVYEDGIEEVATELILIEKKEFIKNELNNYYSEELMLENILDAMLHGRILDDFFDLKCLSGHSFFQFNSDYTLSFNESLANYYTIKKSLKKDRLINDLKMLVGEELIDLFDNYLEINRGSNYGHR